MAAQRWYRIVPVIADVGIAWYDAATYLLYVVIVLRRATLYRVTSREGRARIAELIVDRPGGNARRQAPAEIDMQREPRSHVSVDHVDMP